MDHIEVVALLDVYYGVGRVHVAGRSFFFSWSDDLYQETLHGCTLDAQQE